MALVSAVQNVWLYMVNILFLKGKVFIFINAFRLQEEGCPTKTSSSYHGGIRERGSRNDEARASAVA